MKRFWILSNIDLYNILCPPKLKSYNKQEGSLYTKEDIIYFEKNHAKNVYMVSKGKVKIVKYDKQGNEIVSHYITKGGLFGEKALLGETERNEFAIACNDGTSVCSMNIDNMRQLMRDNENFSTAIYKFIGLRLKKIERRLELIVGKDIKARLASYILDMYEEQNTFVLTRVLTQKELGALLGASRESINKELTLLVKAGVLSVSRKEIKILDIAAIRKFAN